MSRALWEINGDIERILSLDGDDEGLVNAETGEVLDTDALDALDMELGEKLENCGLWVKGEQAMADAIAGEIKALQGRKRAIDNRVAQLKDYMRGGLELKGGRVETPRVRLSLRKGAPRVEVDDAAAIPARWLVPQEPKVDKVGLRDALKAGEDVPGAHLEQGAPSVIVR